VVSVWVVVGLVLTCLIPSSISLLILGDMSRDLRRLARLCCIATAKSDPEKEVPVP
jgi:hypothetical protein